MSESVDSWLRSEQFPPPKDGTLIEALFITEGIYKMLDHVRWMPTGKVDGEDYYAWAHCGPWVDNHCAWRTYESGYLVSWRPIPPLPDRLPVNTNPTQEESRARREA